MPDRLDAVWPRLACFHGVTGYRPFLRYSLGVTREPLKLGLQPETLGSIPLYVIPNPSPANAHFTPADQAAWYDLVTDFLWAPERGRALTRLRRHPGDERTFADPNISSPRRRIPSGGGTLCRGGQGMNAIVVTLLTFVSTTAGGLLAVRVRDKLHLLLGFSSGAILGVVFFDILPELFSRAQTLSLSVSLLMVVLVLGFFEFFFLERITAFHHAREHEHHVGHEHASELGVIGAAGLSVHSFLDGVAIAVGFKSSVTLGAIISVAVLAHDFSDGLNTVTVLLAHRNPVRRSLWWLLIDASAPLAGALSTLLLPIPSDVLPYLLASFAGFFLYIGASDLLPEAREHESPLVAVAAVAGTALLILVTRVV